MFYFLVREWDKARCIVELNFVVVAAVDVAVVQKILYSKLPETTAKCFYQRTTATAIVPAVAGNSFIPYLQFVVVVVAVLCCC